MILNQIYHWARSQPTKTAYINNDSVYNYATFACLIEVTRQFLERQDLPVGQLAIVLSENRGRGWLLVIALRALGLNTIAVRSLEQAEILKLRNVACIVVFQVEHAKLKLDCNSPADAKLIIVPEVIFANTWIGDLPAVGNNAPPAGGHILFSSGTTGSYKKLLLEGNLEDNRNAARALAYHINRDTVYHGSYFGLWTSVGFKMPLAVWHRGGCVVFDTRYEPFRHFYRHSVNLTMLTPQMLRELVESTGGGPCRSNCELLVTAGPLPIALARATVRHITRRIGVAYGSTELCTPAMLSGSTGFLYWLVPGADRTIQIVDEHGHECPPGKEGELRVALSEVDCSCYLDDQEATAKVFQNGHFYPGDMVVRRADGRVRILGRSADVINIGGTKTPVAPVELAVARALGADEVCIFSGLNESGQDELVIAVQSERPLPPSRLNAVTRKFPSFERVRFAVLKEFPRTETETKKVRRSVLRNLVAGEPKK